MPRPASCPAEWWECVIEGCYPFLQDWGARAHKLQWTAIELFGVHSVKPRERIDCMGFVLLLLGAKVVALTATGAEIEKPSGVRLTFRRRDMVPDEMCLLWELET